tara:strand:+ start:1882 stop:2400 length:519 start_codon:yes stop_codon:yes gene_type:complete
MLKSILVCAMALMMSTPAFAQEKNWDKRSGLRFGYGYLNGVREMENMNNPGKVKRLSPHTFVLGFEMQQVLEGGDWLDILFIQNVSISGLDQSVINPSASALVGFEIDKQIQLGVGPNISTFDPSGKDKIVHLIIAAGWTFQAGIFSVPVHFSIIPDSDGYWGAALTTGVNW